MNVNPQVSVVIPAYNVSTYLRDTLISLQNQTLQAFEALIVDDGSTDDTAAIAREFCQHDARFKLLQKTNGGLSSARNYGIRHAATPYIALLDGDDTYEPTKLATHVAILDSRAEVGIVYSISQVMRDDGQRTWLWMSGKPAHSDPLIALLFKCFVGNGSNAVFRRCIFDQAGEFNENLRCVEDVDFWIRVAALRTWTFHRVAQSLTNYRMRPSGLSFNVTQMQSCYEQVFAKAQALVPEIVDPMLPTARAYLYRYLARMSMIGGDTIQAKALIDQALTTDASIFWKDLRSLITLVSVYLAPVVQVLIRQSLGSAKDVKS